jgi:uncharacterized protein
MSINIYTAENRATINWAGGTSTEIFIYPDNTSFAGRDFLFRISTATVEAEETEFTFFRGITRHLMVLKGELQLEHEGRYSKQLKPFDQDTFSGEWKTRSRGKVTDFNLMLGGGAKGSLQHHRIGLGQPLSFNPENDFRFLYIASGAATFMGFKANTGDLVHPEKGSLITIHAEQHCDLIGIEVSLPVNLAQGIR